MGNPGDYGREIRVPVESLAEAERMAWVLSLIGATVEDDRDIRALEHWLVCTFTVHRVIVVVRAALATGDEFHEMTRRLSERIANGG